MSFAVVGFLAGGGVLLLYSSTRVAACAIGWFERRSGRPGFRRPLGAPLGVVLAQMGVFLLLFSCLDALRSAAAGALSGVPPMAVQFMGALAEWGPPLILGAWMLRRAAFASGAAMPKGLALAYALALVVPVRAAAAALFGLGAGLRSTAEMGMWSAGPGASIVVAMSIAGLVCAAPLCWVVAKLVPLRAAPPIDLADDVRLWPEGGR